MNETEAKDAHEIAGVIPKLVRYGTARDRGRDPDVRTVTITDDEAVAILHQLGFETETR